MPARAAFRPGAERLPERSRSDRPGDTFTCSKTARRFPSRSLARASASPARSESTLCTTSNSSATAAALLVWTWPIVVICVPAAAPRTRYALLASSFHPRLPARRGWPLGRGRAAGVWRRRRPSRCRRPVRKQAARRRWADRRPRARRLRRGSLRGGNGDWNRVAFGARAGTGRAIRDADDADDNHRKRVELSAGDSEDGEIGMPPNFGEAARNAVSRKPRPCDDAVLGLRPINQQQQRQRQQVENSFIELRRMANIVIPRSPYLWGSCTKHDRDCKRCPQLVVDEVDQTDERYSERQHHDDFVAENAKS